MQGPLEPGLVHFRAAADVAPLCLGIEFRARTRAAARASFFGGLRGGAPGAFFSFRLPQVAAVFLRALVFRGAGLAQADRDRLLAVLHLAAAAAFQLAVLELVHDARHGLPLCPRLLACHGTSSFALYF